MKRFAVACLTFILGFSATMFFHDEKRSSVDEVTPVTAVSEPEVFVSLIEPKTIISTPFFDSFGRDEYFYGWFIPDEFTGMEEVWTISLNRDEENGKGAVWTAMVFTNNPDGSPNDADLFESPVVKTYADHLTFSTNKIRGIQYKFDGKFSHLGKDFSQDEKVLNGTMQKFVRGKRVAQFTADFSYAEPRCFH